MSLENIDNRFIPVRGLESDILQLTPQNGAVYFAYDTKKIYYGHNDGDKISLIPMGGNSGIYFGEKEGIENGEELVSFSDSLDLERTEFDNDSLLNLNVGDLILNKVNGIYNFFRVTYIQEENSDKIYQSIKLNLAGSGSGGGSGGTSGQSNGVVVLRADTNLQGSYFLAGSRVIIPIDFSAYYNDENHTPHNNVIIRVLRGESRTSTINDIIPVEGKNLLTFSTTGNPETKLQSLDISQLFPMEEIASITEKKFFIEVSADFGDEDGKARMSRISYPFFIVNAVASWKDIHNNINENLVIHKYTDDFSLNYEFNADKIYYYIQFYINGVQIYNSDIIQSNINNLDQRLIINKNAFVNNNFKHGFYDVYVNFYASSTIDGEYKLIKSDPGYMILYDENTENYIIGTSYTKLEVEQYDNLIIPIVIYGKSNFENQATITLTTDQGEAEITNVPNGKWIYFNYSCQIGGIQDLIFETENKTVLTLPLTVKSSEIGQLGQEVDESGGRIFKFLPNSFISNENIKNWTYDMGDGLKTIQFSPGFDWINGGLIEHLDEKTQERYFSFKIKAGNKVIFPFSLFKDNNVYSQGKSLKIIFKVSDCTDLDTTWLKYGSKYKINEETGEEILQPSYLEFTPQEGIIYFNNVNSSIMWAEEELIEMSLDISGENDNKYKDIAHPYISTYIDGTPYSLIERPVNNLTFESNLEIGSDDCDVDIFLIKAYDRSLSPLQHLYNFIADSLYSSKKISRYNRNNVLNSVNNMFSINIDKLIQQNPNLVVHHYEIDRIPTTKLKYNKDVTTDTYFEFDEEKGNGAISGVKYSQYRDGYSDTPYLVHNNCNMGVQGTSSMGYIISAINMDIDFKYGHFQKAANKDFTPEELANIPNLTDDAKKYKLSQHSIGVDYLNAKVNVASAENINNAILADLYQKYNPYISPVRKLNTDSEDLYRDTIEFTNGLIFLTDLNQTVNDSTAINNNVFKEYPNYMDHPTPQFYAICNMGNSKNNTKVFHRSDELCVEIMKNDGHPCQYFADSLSLSDLKQEEHFEFRYKPKNFDDYNPVPGKDKWAYWKDLCDWLYSNNPALVPKDENDPNAEFINEDHSPVSFEPYTFSKAEWLKNITVDTYAGTYTKDCFNYRMAKMLSECEDHLAIDSFVYHYLFLEQHSLIDNVAKNTFWSSNSDSNYQIWDICKDYDNDTGIGIDNAGKLLYTYGHECSDSISKDGIANIFNGSPLNNAWFVFIGNLQQLLQTAYTLLVQRIERINRQENISLLKNATEWQESIPEICWLLDSYRKYRRPYEIYGDIGYLPRQSGGKRQYQRKMFETYQTAYLNSKYLINQNEGSAFELRLRQSTTGGLVPIKLRQKGYIYYDYSGVNRGNPSGRQRVTDLDKYYYIYSDKPGHYDDGSETDDLILYIYEPSFYKELGSTESIEQFKIKDGTLHNYSGSLKEWDPKNYSFSRFNNVTALILGNDNDILAQTLQTKNPISFSETNKLLKTLIAKNLKRDDGYTLTANFNVLSNLTHCDLRNSDFASITIANGAPLKDLFLENPQDLTLSNLYSLDNIVINNYNRLFALYLNNIDVYKNSLSLNLYDNAISLSSIMLNNIDWIIDKSTIRGKSISIDENGAMPFLDDLLNQDGQHFRYYLSSTTETMNPQNAISGKILITANACNSGSSINVYNKYILGQGLDPYSNAGLFKIDLNFEGNLKLYNCKIYSNDTDILWMRKFSLTNGIENNFLDWGIYPDKRLGAFDIDLVTKSSDADKIYDFDTPKWKIKVNGIIKNEEFIGNINDVIEEIQSYISNNQVNGDIEIIPIFHSIKRRYNIIVKTCDEQGQELINQTITLGNDETPIYHDTTIETIIDYIHKIPYRIDNGSSTISNIKIWKWTGLSLDSNYNAKPLTKIIGGITRDNTIFYTTFKEYSISDPEAAFDLKYFDFTPFDTYSSLTLKTDYQIGGKIVIPAYSNINSPICSMGANAFPKDQCNNLTHIYFSSEFKANEHYINTNNQTFIIGSLALYNLTNLTFIDLQMFKKITIYQSGLAYNNKLVLTSLPNIESLGQFAFENSFSNTSLEIASIKAIDIGVFFNSKIKNLTINNLNSFIISQSTTQIFNPADANNIDLIGYYSSLPSGVTDENDFKNNLSNMFSININNIQISRKQEV